MLQLGKYYKNHSEELYNSKNNNNKHEKNSNQSRIDNKKGLF